jgi:hypothetical protein
MSYLPLKADTSLCPDDVGLLPLADISEMVVSVDVMGTFRADTTNRRCYSVSIGEAPPDDEQPQPKARSTFELAVTGEF